MTIETTTTVTCDGCGRERSIVHEHVGKEGKPTNQNFDPWYRVSVEVRLYRVYGQSVYTFPEPTPLDACCPHCLTKALAKLQIPMIDGEVRVAIAERGR